MKRKPHPDQLDIFPPETFLSAEQIDLAVIDAALHHIENQHVIREIQAGTSWSEAFGGPGGSTHPFRWEADANGIRVLIEPPRLIKPARIVARAKEFKQSNPF